jgi:AcrR family transcriptional regulator
VNKPGNKTQRRILLSALKRFADCGYAGASVQEIVDAARVTKPTLYYYFKSKDGLYQALIDWAYDERFHLMQEAAARGGTFQEKLTEVVGALFEFINDHRELMRIAFATAFAARGEIPATIQYLPKCERNFEFIRSLIRESLAAGALDRRFSSRELAVAIWGLISIKAMEHLVNPRRRLGRRDAESIVQLYLGGAARRKPSP